MATRVATGSEYPVQRVVIERLAQLQAAVEAVVARVAAEPLKAHGMNVVVHAGGEGHGVRPRHPARSHDGYRAGRLAEFERELTQERIRSGIAAAKAMGKRLGRQPGQQPKSDRLAPKVLVLVAQGRSYRLVGCEVGLSKNTVAEIARRNRTAAA